MKIEARRLSISHIAWIPDHEESAISKIGQYDISLLEVAPVRTFGNPLSANESDVKQKTDWYRERGMAIGSFQALLFGAEGVDLFNTEHARNSMKEWLIEVGKIAGWCGAGPMVFGSPRNRLKGDLTHGQAMEIAVPFFREIGDACAEVGSCLVMEANPEAYGADFCTRLEQAADLVEKVDSPGFRMHVDAGGLALSGEDFVPVVREAAHLIAHVHASQPNLADMSQPHPVHQQLSSILLEIGYKKSIAIEMRMSAEEMRAVEEAIENMAAIYGV